MKKLLCILITLAMAIPCIGMMTVSAASGADNLSASPYFTLAPDAFPTSAPVIGIENGDAESGLKNWGTLYCTSDAEVIVDPDDETNHIVKFAPGASCDFSTVTFNIGSAIIEDSTMGYYGLGAGTYTISFRARAEEGKGGTFTGYVHSPWHHEAGYEYNGYVLTQNTFKAGTSFEMTDEWTDFAYDVVITEAWLENIYTCFSLGAMGTYDLSVRLDGYKRAFSEGCFGYYIDDLAVSYEPLPQIEDKVFENGDAEDGLKNWETIHGGSIELVQPGANGTENAVKFTPTGGIYNSVAFDLGPAIVQDETEGYYGFGAGCYLVSFWARAEKEGLFKVILNSQMHMDATSINNHIPSLDTDINTWIIAEDVYLTTEWDYYSVLIEVSEEWLETLRLLRAYQVPKYQRAYELEFRIDGSATEGGDYAFKDDLFGYTVDEIMIEDFYAPVGTIYTALEDIEGEPNLYFRSETGLITEADIEDNKITKSFLVGNLGEETIRVKFEMQSTVKTGGVTMWAGQSDGEYIYVEPFTTETLTYTMNVNADNSVTVKGNDCELDTFFYRFDVENGNGEKSIPAGTSVVFYGEGEDYGIVSNLKNEVKNSWEIETAFGYYSVNGWVEEDGNWYYYFLGEMLADTWWFDENGIFYLDENGILAMGTWLFDGDGWCYVGDNGYLVTESWIMDSVGWCYVGSDGYCVTNAWVADSIGWCYLDSEGRMATNQWIMDSVGWCYVGSDGYCVTNTWMADSVGWCYLDSEGRMATNQWIMDSVGWCYVGSDGYCVTNAWVADSIGWCYLDAEGRMVTNDYVYDSNGKCWLDERGYWDGKYC